MASSTQQSDLKVYLRLLRYVLPYWGAFALSIVGFLLFASSQPMLADMLKYFLDGLQSPDSTALLGVPLVYGVPLAIVLIALYQGIGSFLGNYYLAKVARGVVHDLRCALFDNLLILPNRYYDSHNSGHLISRIAYNVTMVTGAATDAIKVVIREGLTVIFLFGYLLWMNWKLTLVLLAILPVIALMVSVASKKFRKQSKKIQDAMGDVTHVASETIQGYRVVRSFGGEAYEQRRFHKASADNMRKSMSMTRTQAIYTPTLQLVIYVGMAVLMYMVLYLRGDATAGELIAYITAGYPDIQATPKIAGVLAGSGCDIIELGIPFSDPLADGATIQKASYQALLQGTTPQSCLEAAAAIRREIATPLVFMTYYNPVLNYGLESFCRSCTGAGINGLIVPDLPPEEGAELEAITRKNNLDLIYLLAPTSTADRVDAVAARSRGFIYMVSLTGVTGARDTLSPELEGFVQRVRQKAHQPLCVGFGISTPEQARRVGAIADGVIVGSRLLQLVEEESTLASLGSFLTGLRRALDSIEDSREVN